MKMMFAGKVLSARRVCLATSVTGRTMERSASLERRQTIKEDTGRQPKTKTVERPAWWEIGNVDGRNEEHPTCMLPLMLPGRDCQ